MSYILDALKKAEQERKRGRTPDVMTEHEDREDRPKRRLWLYIMLVLFAAAAGSAGWYVGSDQYSGVTAKPQQTAGVALNPPAQPQPSTPPSDVPSSENQVSAPQARVAETATPAKETTTAQTDSREPVRKQDAGAPKIDKSSPEKKTAPSAERSRPSQTTPDAIEPTVAKKPVPGNKIYAISELPDEIRQGLPSLSISTHIYSPEKSERLASINGHIGREGQDIMSGITLDSITPDGAILRYQGYRFKVDLK